MLQLRDIHKKKIAGLTEYKNLYIESELQSGDKTLCFSYPKKANFHSDIVEECYIDTKENQYIVKEKNVGSEYTSFKCILNLEELEGQPFERYASEEQTIDKALALALAGTGWIVGKCNLKKRRTVRISNCSSLDIIKEIKKTYRCDLVFNTLTKTIDVYESLGEDKGAYFIDSLNLKDLSIQGNSYDYYTRIIPIGKDDLRISSINNGKDYVENYQYSNKIKTFYWKDERYTVVENLKEDASAKLEELSKPYRSYSAEILNLAKLNDKYKNILDFKLGDNITLISKENKFREKQRIVKIIEHPDEHELDTVELANTTLSFEETQTQFQEAADTVDNITTDNGTIDGSTVDNIETKQISDFEANVIKVTNLTVVNAKIHNLEAQNVNITGKLTAVEATIGTLNSNLATIDKLTVTHSAYIADLQASKVSITQLEAVNATIQVLEGNVSNFETSLSKKASIEQLNATNVIIVELQAKKANIDDLNATNAIITELKATKADIKDLQATNANITNLSSDLANIKTLVNGNLSSENIQAGGITSDKLTIANGFITNAMIANLDVSKVNAGDISTSKFRIKSDDGGIEIVGATQQFKDKNNKVRIQMGKDAQGNFNFIIRGEDGTTTLIDHTGIKQKAIADDLIISNMISSDAVGEKQINYNSFVIGFNKDTNTNTLKATKIKLDNQNQTLEVAFNSLKTQSDGTKNITESHSTSINVMQGQINTAINNTQIVKDGQTILLKDDYNRTVQTVNSINSTLGSHTTQINEATGKITSVDTKVNSVQRDLESTKISVSSNSSKITDLNTVTKNQSSDINLLKNQISLKVEQSDIEKSINETQKITDEKISNAKAEIKITTDSINQTVSNLTTTVSTKADNSTVTNVSNKVSSLETNLNSITGKVSNLETYVSTKADKSTTYTKTETDALIKVKTDEINLNLTKNYSSKTDLTNAINNIAIGGRNLALNTTSTFSNPYTDFTGMENTCPFLSKVLTTGLYIGDSVTVRLIYKYIDVVASSDKTAKCWIQGSGDVTSWSSGSFQSSSQKIINDSGEHEFLYTFEINSNHIKNTYWNVNIRHDYVKSGSVQWKMFKVEKGTKVTDWTPAPEDFEILTDEKISSSKAEIKITTDSIKQDLSNLTTTVTTKADNSTVTSMSNKVASLETNLNGIKGEVSSLETTTTTITTKVNQAQADATKGINDAKTASAKALSAQNTANANKNNITTLTTEVTTVKSNIATLDVNLKGITQRVSSTESTTKTLTTQVNQVDLKINNAKNEAVDLSVGVKDTRSTNESPGWYFANYPKRSVDEFKTFKVLGINTSTAYGVLTTNVPWNDSSGGYPVQTFRSNSSSTYERKGTSNTTWGNWQQVEDTVGAQEKANKALTDAKAYTTTEVTKTNNKVASIETNLNSITSRVSSVETTTTTINGQISNLLTRMNSAEQKITNSSIISTVSSQFYNKNETNAIYASKTQITQLDNKISEKISSIEKGYVTSLQLDKTASDITIDFNKKTSKANMVFNSRFIDNEGWKISQGNPHGFFNFTDRLWSEKFGGCLISTGGAVTYETDYYIEIPPETFFTLSATGSYQTNVKYGSIGVHFYDEWFNWQGFSEEKFGSKLDLCKMTFKSWVGIKYIKVCVNNWGRKNGNDGTFSGVYVKEIKLEDGQNNTSWGPSSGEMETDIIRFSGNGIKVNHRSNGNYTKMSSDGFKYHVGQTGEDYHALSMTGYLVLGGMANVFPKEEWVFLPSSWKGRKFTVSVSVQQTRGGLSVSSEWMQNIELDVKQYNYENASFLVRGAWWSRTVANDVYEKELGIRWIAIC
ncbi:phage tail spike protein [Paraclostridium bifermentans]|uniref:phage tail spike protein n=1 Tax=Paraclostridium bifermentans TaxID=1490 RepID=UPI00387AD707